MLEKSKLLKMEIYNIGCIGSEGLIIDLDNMLCLVGPNNTGKSTVLRAYELAVGNLKINNSDRCNRSVTGDKPTVILHIHIPAGTPNIDENWKIIDGDYLIVKSKWEWDESGSPIRTTWNPSPDVNDFSQDSKASGLDNVFSSRLPIPFRIGALDDPTDEHKKLLTLIIQPIAEKLRAIMKNEDSELSSALKKVSHLAQIPVQDEQNNIIKLKKGINKSHNEIFTNMQIDFNIGIGNVDIDPIKLLTDNSNISFCEWDKEISWNKQGTGSQRALFWSMMQVRSELKTLNDIKITTIKQINDKVKAIEKLTKEIDKAAKEDTKNLKRAQIEELNKEIENLKKINEVELINQQRSELSLPGYMLLIDEPEIALHPNAIRSASRYLYNLANDDSWQIMLTTHSPQFINPLENHTTIIRLDRNVKNPTPQIYKSDRVTFSEDEKENLKLLNRFDTNLAEMFFGQYPIIVEGDTEYAAFDYLINKYKDDYSIADRPLLVRAHGKYTIISLIKILTEFKINFSVLHDMDYPKNRANKTNNAWSANKQIFEIINIARKNGIKVIHRISIPSFEICHMDVTLNDKNEIIDEETKDKPWKMHEKIKSDQLAEKSVRAILDELINKDNIENPFGNNIEEYLKSQLHEWKSKRKIKDKRLDF